MMSSYNYIGTTWAGGSNALLNNVLREEWDSRAYRKNGWIREWMSC